MDREQLLQRLQELFSDFFQNEDLVLDINTIKEDIKDWDSIAHIQIILEIENDFGVQFTAEDISKLDSIKEIVEKIELMK